MPELPEVETVRRGLNQLTLNDKLIGGDVLLDRTIAYPSVTEFLSHLQNQKIATWYRRGKYLLAELSGTRGRGSRVENEQSKDQSLSSQSKSLPAYLGVHLRMTGQLLWLERDEPLHKHTRVRLFLKITGN